MKYYCFNCEQFVDTRRAANRGVIVLLILILGWVFGLGIFIAIIYYASSRRVCKLCKGSNLERRQFSRELKPCPNYKALNDGTCLHYKQDSCPEVKSVHKLNLLEKRGYYCPQIEKMTKQSGEKPQKAQEHKKYICPYCGSIIERKVEYCTFCGQKLEKK